MNLQQISVFLENRAGRLNAVIGLLGDNGINLRALSLADTSDFGILRLIVDKPDKAMKILQKHNFTFSSTEVVAVEVPDVPGGLAGVLRLLTDKRINVEYMYAFVEKKGAKAVIVFRFDNPASAVAIMKKAGVTFLGTAEVVKR